MGKVMARSNDNHQLSLFTKIWLAYMVISTDRKKTKLKTSSNVYCFSTSSERMKAKIIAKT